MIKPLAEFSIFSKYRGYKNIKKQKHKTIVAMQSAKSSMWENFT